MVLRSFGLAAGLLWESFWEATNLKSFNGACSGISFPDNDASVSHVESAKDLLN